MTRTSARRLASSFISPPFVITFTASGDPAAAADGAAGEAALTRRMLRRAACEPRRTHSKTAADAPSPSLPPRSYADATCAAAPPALVNVSSEMPRRLSSDTSTSSAHSRRGVSWNASARSSGIASRSMCVRGRLLDAMVGREDQLTASAGAGDLPAATFGRICGFVFIGSSPAAPCGVAWSDVAADAAVVAQ
jgi:hypothetical protein